MSQLCGVMIALCCHHRCDWSQYVGQQYLLDTGLKRSEFKLLTSMSSWATCGFGKKKSEDKNDNIAEEPEHDYDDVDVHPNDRYTRLGLDDDRRTEIGRMTKRVLDWGRVEYLQQQLSEFNVELKYYVDPAVSLENVILLCTRKC